MSLKAKIEAIIYAAEEPITADQIAEVLKAELAAIADNDDALSGDAAVQESLGEGQAEALAPAEPAQAEGKPSEKDARQQRAAQRQRVRALVDELTADYANSDRAMEIRQIAGGYRMSTKPEHHDVVRAFSKSLKPPLRLSLQALETLAVIAYKQPVTGPEISEIRGVDTSGVLAGLLARKLITTAGRKQVIGRPILYKTTREFLLRFGLKDLAELPSIEEFEKLSAGQVELFEGGAVADATGVPDVAADVAEDAAADVTEEPAEDVPEDLSAEASEGSAEGISAEGAPEANDVAVPEEESAGEQRHHSSRAE